MADGRVIAHGGGDTATGTFTCAIRRAELRDRFRYRIDFTNDCDAEADVVLSRGDRPLQTLLVPPHGHVSAVFTFPAGVTSPPIVADIRCDGTTMRLMERSAEPGPEAGTRRFVVLAACAAACTATVAVLLAVIVWQVLLWRKRRQASANPPEEAPAATHAPLAIVYEEPRWSPNPSPDGNAEVVRPSAERSASGVTYEAHPVHRRPRIGTPVAVAVAVAAIAAIFAFAHPHIGELGAPNEVLQGSAIDVPYATSGMGTLRYRVTSSAGTVVAGGDLGQRSGTLHVAIPVSPRDDAYRIRLTLTGPLGDTSNEATVSAHAMPQARVITRTPAVPNIRSFAVARTAAGSPAGIVAFYDVLADHGTVRLVDARGIQYGSVALDASGEARFGLPNGVDAGTLAVELRAVRGGTTADSRIALPSGSGGLAIAAGSPGSERSRGTENAPIVVPATSVGAGPIRVRILQHYADLHLALIDGKDRKIVGVAVPRSARIIRLAHPPVGVATRVTVQATYRVNNESDMVIRPVILVPAGG